MTAPNLSLRQCPGPGRRQSQAGYLLLEAMVVLGLMGSAVVAYLALQMVQTRIDQGKAVGAHYARINEALGQYMTLHHVALKKLPPDCSVHGLASTTSKTRPAMGQGCSLTINGKSVYNGLQPTAAELVALSLLPAATTDALQLNALVTISEPNRYGTAVSRNWTQPRLLAVITQRCVATQTTSTLQGRYVLVRRPVAADNLALDEIEVMVNGSNVASSAVLSASTAFDDGQTNAAAYYAPSNLTDRLQTRAPSVPYQAPGLFRSLGSNANNPGGAWVQLDLGMLRDISSIGLRAAQGNTGVGATGSTWAAEGSTLSVSVNNAPADGSGNFLTTVTSQIRQANAAGLLPGNMVYVSSDSFGAGTTLDLTPTAQGCPSGSLMALSSLLFNTQPYELPDWQGSGAMLATVTQAAGTEAVMSDPVNGGELTGRTFSIANPLRYFDPNDPSDTTGIGVGGIIAVRNGYDSYSTSLQTRADGSNPPTAAWNFNNKNLTGVDSFESASASVRGDLMTQGALSANKAAFNELKLPVASAGNACSNLTQSVALNSDGQVLTCAGNLWKSSLAGTLNMREYYEVWVTRSQQTFGAGGYFCDASGCGLPNPIISSSNGVATTILKIEEWVPVVLGQNFTQFSVTTNVISHNLQVTPDGAVWSINFTGTDAAVWHLRFYKINP